jgi:hypothetical protein
MEKVGQHLYGKQEETAELGEVLNIEKRDFHRLLRSLSLFGEPLDSLLCKLAQLTDEEVRSLLDRCGVPKGYAVQLSLLGQGIYVRGAPVAEAATTAGIKLDRTSIEWKNVRKLLWRLYSK